MGISYDPMTGEPIETNDDNAEEVLDNVVAEDTEDSEEVSETVDDVVNEDVIADETNEVIDETGVDEENSDDNVTSENVTEAETEVKKPIGYDAMTGQPIYEDDKPSDNNMKKINPSILSVIAGAVLLILIIVIGIMSGAFLSKRAKVEKAIVATCNVKSEFFDVAKKAVAILNGNSIEVDYDFDVDDIAASGKLIMDGKNKQVVTTVNAYSIPKFTLRAGIDSKQISAEVPELSDKLFFYDYTSEKDGMIADELGDNIESVDAACKFFYDITDNREDLQKKVVACVIKHSKELEFETVDSKNYKINGKKVKCKGYRTTIDEDFCEDLFDDLIDIYTDELDESLAAMEELSGTNLKQELKEAKRELNGMPDLEYTFYIYKGKLADIHMESGRDEMDILFRGGDYRAQNIIIEENGKEIASFSGTVKKDKEIYTIEADGDEVVITYNYKKGKVSVEAGRDSIDFELTSSGNSITVTVDEEDLSGTFTLSKNAKIEKYENTDKFDIGNADKYDIEDLIKEIDPSVMSDFSRLF